MVADKVSTLTVREWAGLRLVGNGPTPTAWLATAWAKTGYVGRVHDVLYRLESRGYVVRASMSRGTGWRLTPRGAEVQAEVQQMLGGLGRMQKQRLTQ